MVSEIICQHPAWQTTGKERDQESGLDYFGARYYAPTMGRFISPDFNGYEDDPDPVPYADLHDPQSLNLYGYVGNNPLSRRDPDGHIRCVCQLIPSETANQWGWEIELYFGRVRAGFPLLLNQYFGKKTPALPASAAPAQSTPADPNKNDDEKMKKTEHGEERKEQARQGDANRQGDTQRTKL